MQARTFIILVTTLWFLAVASKLCAQGTAFTYQGRLNDGPALANGAYDLRFSLFGVSSGGTAVAGPLNHSAIVVSKGLFTALLDFGANAFNGNDRWLEVAVRPASSGSFTTLTPRQPVTPTPYAILAANARNALSVASGAAVTRVNNLSDSVTLAAGQNVSITPSGNTLTIGASGNNPWQTSGSSIFYNLGNVGIGTANPAARLEVNAPALADGINLRGTAPAYYLSDAAGTHRASFGYAQSAGFYSTDALAGDSVLRSETGRLLLQNGIFEAGLTLDINRVGIGTTTPHAKLDVRGDIRLGSAGQLHATSGEENLRILRGRISRNGGVLSGLGFTAQRNSEANYTITFNTPFAGIPIVVATTIRAADISVGTSVMTDGVTRESATLVITMEFDHYHNNILDPRRVSIWQDLEFSFIAVGPR